MAGIALIMVYISLFILIAVIFRFIPKQDKKFLVMLVLFAVFIRILAALFLNIFLFGNGIYSPDSQSYHTEGIRYASRINIENLFILWPPPGQGYSFFVGVVYKIFSEFVSVPEVLNIFLSVVTIILIYYLTQQLSNKTAAKISAVLIAVYPSWIFWSTQLAKDIPVIFISILLLYVFIYKTKLKYFFLVNMSALLFLLAFLRNYIALFIGWSLIIAACVIPKIKIREKITSAVSIISIIIILFQILGFGFIGEKLFTNQVNWTGGRSNECTPTVKEAINDLDIARQSMTHANSAFFKEYHFTNLASLITYLPIGFVYYHFSPFPWEMNSFKTKMFIPEMILIYLSWPFIVLGLLYTLKNKFRKAMPILFFTAVLTGFYIIINSSVGTIVRWRMQTYVYLFIFAGIGISLLFKRKSKVNCADTSCPALDQ